MRIHESDGALTGQAGDAEGGITEVRGLGDGRHGALNGRPTPAFQRRVGPWFGRVGFVPGKSPVGGRPADLFTTVRVEHVQRAVRIKLETQPQTVNAVMVATTQQHQIPELMRGRRPRAHECDAPRTTLPADHNPRTGNACPAR